MKGQFLLMFIKSQIIQGQAQLQFIEIHCLQKSSIISHLRQAENTLIGI